MSRSKLASKAPVPSVRCAIYTRKSSEEGLDQEYNSLDAQRDSAEAFIASQKAEGWMSLPERYDDGGFSGGSIDRPAMERLLADIKAGNVDCVVVYKVDRLSRSLMDFARIMEVFEQQGVSFVSVTQHFNTTHSMGRLTLNILLSFAQFEREIIGERIRDKLAAQARRGKWTGGAPVLGYDVDRTGPSPRLVVNAEEAERVRDIFGLYIEKGSLLPVVQELKHRGWANKLRKTKDGRELGGRPFDRATLHALLTNPIFVGKIRHKKELFEGEHPAIVDLEVFRQVQETLQHNGRRGGAEVRNKYGALLRGLLRCKSCDCAMSHSFTTRRGARGQQYRYYRCCRAVKEGRDICSVGSVPAAEMEVVVIDQVRRMVTDPRLLADTISRATKTIETKAKSLKREISEIERELARHHAQLQRLAVKASSDGDVARQMDELHRQIAQGEQRVAEKNGQLTAIESETPSKSEVIAALSNFDKVWSQLSPRDQARTLSILIDQVEYDGKAGTVAITFRETGILALAKEQLEEAA